MGELQIPYRNVCRKPSHEHAGDYPFSRKPRPWLVRASLLPSDNTACIVVNHLDTMISKLLSIHEKAGHHARRELRLHRRSLADLVADIIEDGRWNNLSTKDERQLRETLELARRSANTLNAISFLETRVLASHNGKAIDIKLKRDLADAQAQILDKFESGEAPKRGFVYVSWSQRPEQYFYVGKARTVDRLNLSQHGKLANTVGRASTLSLIFPHQSSEETLLGVEASILNLLEVHMGNPPELNARVERIPTQDGSDELAGLQGFILSVASMIEA